MRNRHFSIRLRRPSISFLIDIRALTSLILLTFLCLIAVVLSIGTGEMNISPWNVIKSLTGFGDPGDTMIVLNLRLPRVLTALLVGISIAVSGAILQGIMRNPLASPDIIGITGGASVAAVAFLTLFSHLGVTWLPAGAFIGGTCAAIMIYVLAWKKGVSPLRLVLIGVGVNSAANGLTTLLLILSPLYAANQAIVWLAGSVYASSWDTVWTLLPWFFILIPLSLILTRQLNVQQMGESIAVGLGNSLQRQQLLLVLVSVALASSAVAASGPIAFVGLMAPHIARMLTGPSFGSLLPVSGVIGGILVTVADWIGRTAFSPLDLPAGLFTAVLGAPFLIYLLYRTAKVH